ncbi:unnamed protein product [Brugia timori]|uniref:Na_H_Exchanger domain-containing protein n=1 Tax=Brugia timori TaxID=42155 RepID=A0A0R3QHT6_9BILA|nr:unnamed protein product [Brugia timori]
MLMGAILAATDPVAVVAILEDIGAPQRIKILVEGESLLNDGLAIFVYQILRNFVLKEVNLPSYPYTFVHYAAMCVSCIVISPLLGYTSAHITVMIIRHGISEEKRIQVIHYSFFPLTFCSFNTANCYDCTKYSFCQFPLDSWTIF